MEDRVSDGKNKESLGWGNIREGEIKIKKENERDIRNEGVINGKEDKEMEDKERIREVKRS